MTKPDQVATIHAHKTQHKGKIMSYRMYMEIEREKQLKAIASRYRKANVNSVEEAEKIEKRYWDQVQ